MLRPGCLAPHPPASQADCMRLEWLDPRLDGRCRVRDWTCDCRAVYYELCESGGLAFVRRVVQGDDRIVAETHRVRIAEAHAIWKAILSGQAR
ncbi:hypothetical protein [Thermoactinospora rubra]|uniref:hypothetical protein n=1 Tax=Thermoactinospora rubra TaxID=1088767 RepID=UPI000A10FA4B|nr:hypothetical protein [Thermoactinospora rubra]